MNSKILFVILIALLIAGCATADLPPIDEQKDFEPLIDEQLLWNRARDEQARLANEYKGMLSNKSAQLSNAVNMHTQQDHRQQLLDEELIKAEAQIKLIKDILLG